MRADRSRRHRVLRPLGWLLALLLLLSGAAAGLVLKARSALEHRVAEAPARDFEVTPGESLRSVLDRLAAMGLVESPRFVELWLRGRGDPSCLKAGLHRLARAPSVAELLRELCEAPPPPTVRVTIPEGATLWQVDAILASTAAARHGELLDLGADPHEPLVARLPSAERFPPQRYPNRLEGYLFPDTYEIPVQGAATALVRKATARVRQVMARLYAEGPHLWRPLSRHAVLTLAAIVEREAMVHREMPHIAAVYLNRLARGMPLQADPTLTYAPGSWNLVPSPSLRADRGNPYNTYAHGGLPPGPIGAPGRRAIDAVLRPAPTRALFFVARGDGSGLHVFSRTYREHRRNVADLRRQRKLQRQLASQ